MSIFQRNGVNTNQNDDAVHLCLLIAVVTFLFTLLIHAVFVSAAPKEFDPYSGEDVKNYPPDQPVDFRHLKLELVFEDLTSKSFSGIATLTVSPVHEEVMSLTLDAMDLHISKVRINGRNDIHFDHDDKKLFLHFNQPLSIDHDTIIRIEYRCTDPAYGMIWALPDKAYPDRPLVIHTQGEPEFARMWYP